MSGNTPECLYVKDDQLYIGKITPTGRFHRGYGCTDAMEETVRQISNDPLAAAMQQLVPNAQVTPGYVLMDVAGAVLGHHPNR